MQRDLFILYLQFPQPGEEILYQRYEGPLFVIHFYLSTLARPAGDLMVHDFYLPDATLSIVFDPLANEYRMILMSCCTSMCVSMKCKSFTTRLCILLCSPTYSDTTVLPKCSS
jgi:hypothetical protein